MNSNKYGYALYFQFHHKNIYRCLRCTWLVAGNCGLIGKKKYTYDKYEDFWGDIIVWRCVHSFWCTALYGLSTRRFRNTFWPAAKFWTVQSETVIRPKEFSSSRAHPAPPTMYHYNTAVRLLPSWIVINCQIGF